MSTVSFLYFQLHRFVSINKLKYFFAVDTAYVAKKLGLLVFPYTHQVSFLPGELASLSPLVSNLTDPQISTPSLVFSASVYLTTSATARTGKCSTVMTCLCPHGKTSMRLTSISPVSL